MKHKLYAIGLFIIICTISINRNGLEVALVPGMYLALCLAGILFCEVIAFLSPFGFWESRAKDNNIIQKPGIYAFLFWVLFLVASGFSIFYEG